MILPQSPPVRIGTMYTGMNVEVSGGTFRRRKGTVVYVDIHGLIVEIAGLGSMYFQRTNNDPDYCYNSGPYHMFMIRDADGKD